ncbi:hypothetical protein [Ensifer sp. MJa1]|uniref:hypothetical protein n=1 Tax=Ensifer sp. MJa1 TaxID=2919888 RepID=UPI00300B09AB
MDNLAAKQPRQGANSPSELQDIAQKLSALAQHIKSIAAAPLGEPVDLNESGKLSRKAKIE